MSKIIENVQDLVKQSRNNSFEGFKVSLDEKRFDETFEGFIESGKLSGINLFNVPENQVNNMDGVDNFLSGQKVGVYAKGKKLFESTISKDTNLRFGGSSESISLSDAINKEPSKVLPGLPDKIHTWEDVATAFDIKKLNFKPVSKEKAKDKTEQVAESENVKLLNKVAKPLGAIATVITLVLTIKRYAN